MKKTMTLIVGLSLFPASGFALTPSDIFLQLNGSVSFEKLRRTTETMRRNPAVQELLSDTKNYLSATQMTSDAEIETTRFQHFFKGIEVVGSMSLTQSSHHGTEVYNRITQFDLDTRPSLSITEAVALAKSFAGDRELTHAPELRILPADDGYSAQLVYWVELRETLVDAGREVIINAQSGALVASLSHVIPLATVDVRSAQNQGLAVIPTIARDAAGKSFIQECRLLNLASREAEIIDSAECRKLRFGNSPLAQGQCQIVDSLDGERGNPSAIDSNACLATVTNNEPSATADEASLRAQHNSTKVLRYFQKHHGRDSFDGNGAKATSIVHIGLKYANAAWVKGRNLMIYGSGDGKKFGDFTRALDVAGHEMTHGVNEHSAKLLSMGESGALNEAIADFFGKMAENRDDWAVGRALGLDSSYQGTRNLAHPGDISTKIRDKDGNVRTISYPAHNKDKLPSPDSCDDTNDRCWVHVNATIPGHGLYLITQAIGKPRAEKLTYRVLTHFLTARSNFKQWGVATRLACWQMFDIWTTCGKVADALSQVGL